MLSADHLKVINISTAFAAFVFIFAIFAPGSLIIFLYDKQLFLDLDILKLMLLSIALTIPSFIGPYFISIIARLYNKQEVDQISGAEHLKMILEHGANSGISIYIAITLSYFLNLSFKWFLAIYALATIGHVIAEFILQSKKAAQATSK